MGLRPEEAVCRGVTSTGKWASSQPHMTSGYLLNLSIPQRVTTVWPRLEKMPSECVLALASSILTVPTPILQMTEGGHTAWVPDLKAL